MPIRSILIHVAVDQGLDLAQGVKILCIWKLPMLGWGDSLSGEMAKHKEIESHKK